MRPEHRSGTFRARRRADESTRSGILVDDNDRKPICRLHLNRSQWYIGLFDAEKNEHRHPLGSVDEIYTHADELTATALRYADTAEKSGTVAVEAMLPVDGSAPIRVKL